MLNYAGGVARSLLKCVTYLWCVAMAVLWLCSHTVYTSKCDFKADIRYMRKFTNIKQAAHSSGARRIYYSKIFLVSR